MAQYLRGGAELGWMRLAETLVNRREKLKERIRLTETMAVQMALSNGELNGRTTFLR